MTKFISFLLGSIILCLFRKNSIGLSERSQSFESDAKAPVASCHSLMTFWKRQCNRNWRQIDCCSDKIQFSHIPQDLLGLAHAASPPISTPDPSSRLTPTVLFCYVRMTVFTTPFTRNCLSAPGLALRIGDHNAQQKCKTNRCT